MHADGQQCLSHLLCCCFFWSRREMSLEKCPKTTVLVILSMLFVHVLFFTRSRCDSQQSRHCLPLRCHSDAARNGRVWFCNYILGDEVGLHPRWVHRYVQPTGPSSSFCRGHFVMCVWVWNCKLLWEQSDQFPLALECWGTQRKIRTCSFYLVKKKILLDSQMSKILISVLHEMMYWCSGIVLYYQILRSEALWFDCFAFRRNHL